VDIIMWFKRFKELRDPEIKSLRFVLGRYQLFIWKDIEGVVNHNERDSFVEAWLAEPRMVLIDLKMIQDQIKEEHEQDKWEKLDYVD